MYINVGNSNGEISLTPAQFETFRNYCLTGQKIQAIKFVRDTFATWGLKEAKDFVDGCFFSGYCGASSTLPQGDILGDIKDNIRSIILDKSDYRETLLLDLFGRVASRVGVRKIL